MKRQAHYLEYLYCLLLIAFQIGRAAFILNNRALQDISLPEALGACWRGFVGHDLMVAALLLVLPWLAGLLSLRHPTLRLRAWLTPYYIILGLSIALLTAADAVMYEYWHFKISTIFLSYAESPEGVTNSVSFGYVFWRASALLAFGCCIAASLIRLTPKRLPADEGTRLWMRNISIIWAFLIVSACCFMSLGDVYGHPRRTVANHAAVNPVYAFLRTIHLSDNYADRCNWLSEAERADLFDGLYPEPADDVQDTLLAEQHPDILVIFLEGLGARFVETLGGIPDVTPGLTRLSREGIDWQNFYSSSFRTDRAISSTFSGCISYPDISLQKQAELHPVLPSLARSLSGAGYQTAYLYGGNMSNMGKRRYLQDMDFDHLYDNTAFAAAQNTGGWGVPDSTVGQKARQLISQWKPNDHHFLVMQPLSSHEPWQVPYQRLQDEKLNAFAYSDYSVACTVDSLRQLPQWERLLIIILPDHGTFYDSSYDDPAFFHAPMLWLGGAIRSPRQMQVLMNQSDLAATLLAQLGLQHREYPWSRNVLSSTYTQPFAYSNYPAGFLYKDSTGITIYDTDADLPIVEEPADGGLRALRAKAIQQTGYDRLQQALQQQ